MVGDSTEAATPRTVSRTETIQSAGVSDRITTRFAPSPTGELHLGNARTALFSWLFARHHGGRFVLRIEDTDTERSKEAYTGALMEDLRWMGLEWDAGPGRAAAGRGISPVAPRRDLRAPFGHARRARPHVSRATARRSSSTCRARRSSPPAGRRVMPAPAASLSAEARVRKSAQGISPTTRFRVPTGKRVEFDDMVHGAQSFATDDIGDFILRRADGSAAFFFSNAIDDAEMGITHVLRGEDHLTNTPRQLLVLEALQLRAPTYGHLSLLVGADGSPLSKRHGATSVREFRERGYLPGALANHLFRLGHSSGENGVLTLDGMARAFTVKHLGPRAGAFRGIAAQCLAARSRASHAARRERALARRRDAARHRRDAPPRVHRRDPAERAAAVGRRALARSGVRRRAGARRELARARARSRARSSSARPPRPRASGGKLDAIVNAVKAATGAKGQALWKPLRLALTGTPEGPELAPLLRAMPDSSHPRSPEPIRRMIRIHNSLTGEKQELKPIEPGHVRMYSCGITVYDYFHVGNARMLVVFDMVSRYLRHRGLRVTYVRNITDVDDKIINRARESGVDWRAHAAKFTAAMHEDLDSARLPAPGEGAEGVRIHRRDADDDRPAHRERLRVPGERTAT